MVTGVGYERNRRGAGNVSDVEPRADPDDRRYICQVEVDNGSAIGVKVGTTLGDKPPSFFSYGLARYGAPPRERERFTEDTLFQIGSITKIFTTNLLGLRQRQRIWYAL